jgi:hypothetical protein
LSLLLRISAFLSKYLINFCSVEKDPFAQTRGIKFAQPRHKVGVRFGDALRLLASDIILRHLQSHKGYACYVKFCQSSKIRFSIIQTEYLANPHKFLKTQNKLGIKRAALCRAALRM